MSGRSSLWGFTLAGSASEMVNVSVLSRSACSVVVGDEVKGFNHRGHRGSQRKPATYKPPSV